MNKLVIVDDAGREHLLIQAQKIDEKWFMIFLNGNYDKSNLKLKIDKDDALINISNGNENSLLTIEEKLYIYESGIVELQLEDLYVEKNISPEQFDEYIRNKITNTTVNIIEEEPHSTREEYFKEKKKQNLAQYNTNTATKVIIAINIVVFILFNMGFIPYRYVLHGLISISNFSLDNIIGIFISGFLQWTILHLFFNMWFLFSIGSNIERLIGKTKFIILYMLLILLSGLSVLFLTDPLLFTAGASGALFGLLGFIISYLKMKSLTLSELHNTGLISVLVINVIFTFIYPNISIAGHISGLIFGLIFGAIFAMLDKKN